MGCYINPHWELSQPFLEIMRTIYNLNPTPFLKGKKVLEKSTFLDIFQRLVQFHKIKLNPIQKKFQ